MIDSNNYYKISELSQISETPVPTIRYYIKEGLLPPPIKTGKTFAYYSDNHLSRLNIIKKLQTGNPPSLAAIKEKLDKLPVISPPDEGTLIVSSEKRNAIVSAAIKLFIEKGLGGTSIDDIVTSSKIGKGTFYKYFKDKNDLFFQCADRVFYEMYSHVWKEIKDERDMSLRLFKRAEAFFYSYPKWVDMMNLVRHASTGDDPFFKNRFKEILNQITQPIARDIKVLQQENKINRNHDCLGLAYLLMGLTEYAAWLIYNSNNRAKDISIILNDLMINGLQKKDSV